MNVIIWKKNHVMFVFKLNFHNFQKKKRVDVDHVVCYNIVTIRINIFNSMLALFAV
jgi:hypothetical protein